MKRAWWQRWKCLLFTGRWIWRSCCTWFSFGLFPSSGHQAFVTTHAEYALRCAGVAQIIDLPLAAATSETASTECLIAGQYSEVFDLVSASAATVSTVVTDERTVSKKEKIGIRVEKGTACMAAKTIYMPSITGWLELALVTD